MRFAFNPFSAFLLLLFISCNSSQDTDNSPFYSGDPRVASEQWIKYNGDTLAKVYRRILRLTEKLGHLTMPLPDHAPRAVFTNEKGAAQNALFVYEGGPGWCEDAFARAGEFNRDTAKFSPVIEDTTLLGQLLRLKYVGVVVVDEYRPP